MPKVVYTAAKGLVQETGSGFEVSDVGLTAAAAAGVTCNGFFAGFVPNAALDTRTDAGAVSVTSYMTYVVTTTASAITLANGTAAGQLKKIMMSVDAGDATLTIATPFSAGTNQVVFSNIGDTVELIWTGSYWRILAAHNVAAGNTSTPVVS
jgi:hypothetical protein